MARPVTELERRREHHACASMDGSRRGLVSQHKFKVGDDVNYSPAKLSVRPASRRYRIVRCLPEDAGEFLYRIKSHAEHFERVVRERELSDAALSE